MAPGDGSRLYHRLTSYGPDRNWPPTDPPKHPLLLRDFQTRELATFTAPCKSYEPGLPTTELAKTWPAPIATATDVLVGHAEPAEPDLARILFLSAGVVRPSERADGRFYHFRAAGSAGGRCPLEVYVANDNGVHWYDPIRHALITIGPPPAGDATTLIVTGIPLAHGLAVRRARLPPPLHRHPRARLDAPDGPASDRPETHLGRDAAFVVVGATDLAAITDRGYREAQLQAGIVEGRLHIAAYALGIGASGMTFLDSEIEAPRAAGAPGSR